MCIEFLSSSIVAPCSLLNKQIHKSKSIKTNNQFRNLWQDYINRKIISYKIDGNNTKSNKNYKILPGTKEHDWGTKKGHWIKPGLKWNNPHDQQYFNALTKMPMVPVQNSINDYLNEK